MRLELLIRLIGGVAIAAAGWSASDVIEATLPALPRTQSAPFLALIGFLLGALVAPHVTIRPLGWVVEQGRRISAQELYAVTFGLLVGLVFSALLAIPLSLLPGMLGHFLPFVGLIMVTYLCITIVLLRRNEILGVFGMLRRAPTAEGTGDRTNPGAGPAPVLLDTSVIIDGRIADISRTGFLPGPLLVPRFVLAELQHIADSADAVRRNRGRRGLDVLNKLRKDPSVPFSIHDIEVNGSGGVDAKLVRLARQLRCPILTNDFNLNRVAALQGVRVLNVNELANAVKAVVLPGEELQVRVIQEGKEPGQGVGYLDDGTMIVVEGGRDRLNDDVDVVVTRVLQTAAGRMIFGHLKGE